MESNVAFTIHSKSAITVCYFMYHLQGIPHGAVRSTDVSSREPHRAARRDTSGNNGDESPHLESWPQIWATPIRRCHDTHHNFLKGIVPRSFADCERTAHSQHCRQLHSSQVHNLSARDFVGLIWTPEYTQAASLSANAV